MLLKPIFKRLPAIRLVHLMVRRLHRFSAFPGGVQTVSRQFSLLDTPICFIQGLKDHISTPDQSRWLYDHLIRAPKFYWAIPEAHHMTNLRMRPDEYQKRVVAFLDRYLADKATQADQQNCGRSLGGPRQYTDYFPMEQRS